MARVYPRTVACRQCGRKTEVHLSHPWTPAELVAQLLLPCRCFSTNLDAPVPLTSHMALPEHGEKRWEPPLERDLVMLAATSIQCHRGHMSKDTTLQAMRLAYQGACAECGPEPVELHAELKRRA